MSVQTPIAGSSAVEVFLLIASVELNQCDEYRRLVLAKYNVRIDRGGKSRLICASETTLNTFWMLVDIVATPGLLCCSVPPISASVSQGTRASCSKAFRPTEDMALLCG